MLLCYQTLNIWWICRPKPYRSLYIVLPYYMIHFYYYSNSCSSESAVSSQSLSFEVDPLLAANDCEIISNDLAPEIATGGTDSSAVAVETEHWQQTEEQATTEVEMQSTDEASIHAKDGLNPAINYGDFHQVVNYKCSIQRELTDHEKTFFA